MPTARRPLIALAACAAMLPLAACYDDGYGPYGYGPPPPPPPPGYYGDQPPPGYAPPAPDGYDRAPPPQGDGYDHRPPPAEYRGDRPPPAEYRGDRPPPAEWGYAPEREYRPARGAERALSRDDEVYRGRDGRVYCRRSDGSTGLVVGAVAGALLGNVFGGHTLGTLLGAGGGALLGQSVDQGQVRCR